MEMNLRKMFEIFDHKKVDQILSNEIKNTNWNMILIYLLMSMAANLVAGVIHQFIYTQIAPSSFGFGLDLTTRILVGIFGAVLGIGLFFFFGWITFSVARAIGGQGNLIEQLYLQSYVGFPFSIIGAILAIINVIPFIACLGFLISLVLGIYGLYVLYKIIMLTHQLNSKNAIIVMAVTLVIQVIIMLIIGFVIMLTLSAWFGFNFLRAFSGGLPANY